MSKSELQVACKEAGITISSKHVGIETTVEEGKKHFQDKWMCTIHFKGKSESFDYFTGIGHRVCAPGVKKKSYLSSQYELPMGNVVYGDEKALSMGILILKKVKNPTTKHMEVLGPEVADVLSCLLSEMSACSTSFDNWCSDFGANNDSIKAHNTYLACQKNGDKVRKLLGPLADELSGKSH